MEFCQMQRGVDLEEEKKTEGRIDKNKRKPRKEKHETYFDML